MLRAAVAAMAPHSLESGRHAEGPPVSDAWLWHHRPQGNHHSSVFGCPFFFMCEDFFSRNSSSHGDCGLIPRGGQSTDLVARHKDEVRANMAAMVRKVTSSSPTGSAAE